MIVLNCIRYLGMTDINEIGRLTLYEYDLLMTGKALAAVDESHKAHKQAWINYQVTATKLVGGKKNKKEVPVYKKFEDFFDYEEEIRKITQENDEGYDKKGMDLLLKANL
ncbi:TPA: hypothetical protein ACQM6A_000853 [Streptococcus pyogenes]|uniref:hypothetical protein n=1 Tax=Streptococcus pyogenes TaxID=1314 RepID=UPI00109BC701|nr:hypothetical protein [Streptococcus pyogenes]VGQ76978.1 phage protein [Streptococcus pyogenes]VGT52108.1 phage protein [Streptococcus pyogenes]VGX93907.1 phage protein [Streptococcus pyogenes]VHE72449.1 phage protein [Streptococcus pyogenes]VHF31823.1 phage protein [Streptococcus pyogenes]